MISIQLVSNPSGAFNYYSSGDYYIEGEQIASQWNGKGAELLELSKDVDRDTFETLLSGEVNGEQVGRNSSETKHRGAWDITFSAPKSVSIMALLPGGDKR